MQTREPVQRGGLQSTHCEKATQRMEETLGKQQRRGGKTMPADKSSPCSPQLQDADKLERSDAGSGRKTVSSSTSLSEVCSSQAACS